MEKPWNGFCEDYVDKWTKGVYGENSPNFS
jgi:hypothetical protein